MKTCQAPQIKCLPSNVLHRALAVAAVTMAIHLAPAAAEIFPMSFETGYVSGSSLTGQGDGVTKWASVPSNAASLKVTTGAGYGGTQGIVSSPVTATQTYTYSPSGTDLPGFSGTSSLVDFSIRCRYNGGTTASTAPSLVVRLGAYGSSAVILTLRQDGSLTYNTGWSGTSQMLKADGAPLTISDTTTWVNLVGRMNYGNKTYTLAANGVP